MVTVAVNPKKGSSIPMMFSTVPFICEPLSYQPIAYTKQCYNHLANLELADSSRVGEELQIDALIGSDHYWQLVTGQIIQGDSGPTAIHTRLGWVLSGPVCCGTTELNNLYPTHSMLIQSYDSPQLDNLLKKFWDLESLGINADEPSVLNKYRDEHPESVEKLLNSLNVDEMTCGANTEDETYQLFTVSNRIFAEGGFNLRKFVTNSLSFKQKMMAKGQSPGHAVAMAANNSHNVVEENATYASSLFIDEMSDCQKILGVSWNPEADRLVIDLRETANSLRTLKSTKRNEVGFSSKFYDPLVFLSPVIITLKIFFQELCRVKISWDDPLSSELLSRWHGLVANFQEVVISVPRCCYFPACTMNKYVLYGFCDASKSTYTVVVYLCNGSGPEQFVVCKTRVAPLVKMTIPRLELFYVFYWQRSWHTSRCHLARQLALIVGCVLQTLKLRSIGCRE